MGADMIISGLVLKMNKSEGKAPWKNPAALFEKRLNRLLEILGKMKARDYDESAWAEVMDYYGNGSDRTFPEYVEGCVKDALNCLPGREVAFWQIGGLMLALSGGMSGGDSPTDAEDAFDKITRFPMSLLKKAGFE